MSLYRSEDEGAEDLGVGGGGGGSDSSRGGTGSNGGGRGTGSDSGIGGGGGGGGSSSNSSPAGNAGGAAGLGVSTGGMTTNDALLFHEKCGTLIKLSNNNKTAERRRPLDEFNNGVVMTNRPLRHNEMFEVWIFTFRQV